MNDDPTDNDNVIPLRTPGLSPVDAMAAINLRTTCYYAVLRTYRTNPHDIARPHVQEGPMVFFMADPFIYAAEESAAGRVTIVMFSTVIDMLVYALLVKMGTPNSTTGGAPPEPV